MATRLTERALSLMSGRFDAKGKGAPPAKGTRGGFTMAQNAHAL